MFPDKVQAGFQKTKKKETADVFPFKLQLLFPDDERKSKNKSGNNEPVCQKKKGSDGLLSDGGGHKGKSPENVYGDCGCNCAGCSVFQHDVPFCEVL